jgi:hypothetical protein
LLNFQSAQNETKIVPLRPSRLPDSGGIFTFSNGVRMEKISRSVRQAKQAKILDADCTCPYSLYGDVAGPYRPYTEVMWQLLIGRSLASTVLTCVIRWPIMGGHVAQSKGATCRSLVG